MAAAAVQPQNDLLCCHMDMAEAADVSLEAVYAVLTEGYNLLDGDDLLKGLLCWLPWVSLLALPSPADLTAEEWQPVMLSAADAVEQAAAIKLGQPPPLCVTMSGLAVSDPQAAANAADDGWLLQRQAAPAAAEAFDSMDVDAPEPAAAEPAAPADVPLPEAAVAPAIVPLPAVAAAAVVAPVPQPAPPLDAAAAAALLILPDNLTLAGLGLAVSTLRYKWALLQYCNPCSQGKLNGLSKAQRQVRLYELLQCGIGLDEYVEHCRSRHTMRQQWQQWQEEQQQQ